MLISLTQDCYESLRKIKEEMKEQKRQSGKPEKTTFSEIVCMFIQKYELPMMKNEEGRLNLSSPPPPTYKG
jgi:predicted CopG family antitoxin